MVYCSFLFITQDIGSKNVYFKYLHPLAVELALSIHRTLDGCH